MIHNLYIPLTKSSLQSQSSRIGLTVVRYIFGKKLLCLADIRRRHDGLTEILGLACVIRANHLECLAETKDMWRNVRCVDLWREWVEPCIQNLIDHKRYE